MYYMLKVKNMEQQTLQFNQAQLQLLDMMSFVKTPEALSDLNKAISDYFVKNGKITESVEYKNALARMKMLSGKGGRPVPADENRLLI